jgi:hypothetical protein
MPGEAILQKPPTRMDHCGTRRHDCVGSETLSNSSLKRENVSRRRHEDAKKSAKSDLPAKQKNSWKNPFLSKGFHKRNQIIPKTGQVREPGRDTSDTDISAVEPDSALGSSDGDFGGDVEMGEHGILSGRVSLSRSGFGWDSMHSKSPMGDSDIALDRRISSHTTVSSGEELAIEQQFVLIPERSTTVLSRLDGRGGSANSSGSRPLVRGDSGSRDLQTTISMQADASRRKSRPRMSVKDAIRLELLEERLAPPELPPALLHQRGLRGASRD